MLCDNPGIWGIWFMRVFVVGYAVNISPKYQYRYPLNPSKLNFWYLVPMSKHIFGIQLNPGNSNCQGKLKLLRVIRVSSCRGF